MILENRMISKCRQNITEFLNVVFDYIKKTLHNHNYLDLKNNSINPNFDSALTQTI